MAIPVVFLTRESAVEVDASSLTAAAGVRSDGATTSNDDTTSSESPHTTVTVEAGALLVSVDRDSLFGAGANPEAALEEHETGTSAVVTVAPAGGDPASGASAVPGATSPSTGPGPVPPTLLEVLTAPIGGGPGTATPGGPPATTPTSVAPRPPATSSPSSGAPATAAPTTAAPTTAAPATATPTTAAPVTAAPTTAAPVTAAPTTAAPTTAAPTTAPPTTATPTTVAPVVEATEAPPGEPTAAQWAALRRCESGGDYTIVSANGRHHGAYQFSQGTWDNIARAVGRTDLVGVAPSAASAADQDGLALALWRDSGWSSWPHCGAVARNS